MKNQDRATMMVLRSVLSAISNREAVPAVPPDRENPMGRLGFGDVGRRELTPQEVKLVLLDEVDERRNSAGYLRTAGRNEEAARLEAEAAILERYLYLT
jgi:uncharacterized protein YqeY